MNWRRALKGYGTEGGKAASNYRNNWDNVFDPPPEVIDEDDDYDSLFLCPCDLCMGESEAA